MFRLLRAAPVFRRRCAWAAVALGVLLGALPGAEAANRKTKQAPTPPPAGKPATPPDDFLALRDAFSRGDRKAFERLLPKVAQDPLAAYAEAFDLRMRFSQEPAEAIDVFLERHAGEYVAERLRADWARKLASEDRWDEFGPVAAGLLAAEPELRCARASHALARGESAAPRVAEGLAVFEGSKDLPPLCDRMAATLADAGLLSVPMIWHRGHWLARLGRTGPAAATLRLLPQSEQPGTAALSQALNHPERFLGALDGPIRTSELVRLALGRLAKSDLTAAAGELQRLAPHLPATVAGGAWSDLGLLAAQRHDARALDWFTAAGVSSMRVEAHEWHVRAALRQGQWPAVARAIAAMPQPQRDEAPWRYWLARAHQAAGEAEPARVLFEAIAGNPNFYGSLASEELGRPVELPPRASAPTREELAEAERNVSLVRALSFFSRNLRFEGVREWNWGLRGLSDRQLLAAAVLARRAGIFDRAISAADRTQQEHDYALRFLAPFDAQVRPAAQAQALDAAWVYGLMRQESRFITDARSSAGASGLMQLMPATARWVANKIGLKEYRHSKVTDHDVNLLLGTSYMRMVMDSLDNHPVLASAAYNAGPGRARRWRDPARPLEGAIYAETIPFDETRDYVKKVMSNTVFYSALFTGRPDSLKRRLGVIAPAGAPDTTRELP